MKYLRKKLLSLLAPFLLWFGRLHLPYTQRHVTQAQVETALTVLEVGDVIVTRERGAPTNLLIPGVFTHAAIYVGNGQVVEAVGAGVRVTGIWDLLLGSKDRFAVCRSSESDRTLRATAGRFAFELVGLPYDILLQLAIDYGKTGDLAVYCAEAPWIAHVRANPLFQFRGQLRLGAWTIEPQDYVESPLWAVVYDSGKGRAA